MTTATLNGRGMLAIVDDNGAGEEIALMHADRGMDGMCAEAEQRLALRGWRKAGRWSHTAVDWQHQWVAVEPLVDDTLVGTAEIARLAGVKPATVQAWTERHESFPEPERTLAMGRVWRWGDVAAWLAIPRRPGRPSRPR